MAKQKSILYDRIAATRNIKQDFGGSVVEGFTVQVLIDQDEVMSMAHRAARNKTGKSRKGPIEVLVTSRWRVS